MTGVRDGIVLVDVAAPPEDGLANKELERFLAKAWSAEVTVVVGSTKKDKIVKVVKRR